MSSGTGVLEKTGKGIDLSVPELFQKAPGSSCFYFLSWWEMCWCSPCLKANRTLTYSSQFMERVWDSSADSAVLWSIAPYSRELWRVSGGAAVLSQALSIFHCRTANQGWGCCDLPKGLMAEPEFGSDLSGRLLLYPKNLQAGSPVPGITTPGGFWKLPRVFSKLWRVSFKGHNTSYFLTNSGFALDKILQESTVNENHKCNVLTTGWNIGKQKESLWALQIWMNY